MLCEWNDWNAWNKLHEARTARSTPEATRVGGIAQNHVVGRSLVPPDLGKILRPTTVDERASAEETSNGTTHHTYVNTAYPFTHLIFRPPRSQTIFPKCGYDFKHLANILTRQNTLLRRTAQTQAPTFQPLHTSTQNPPSRCAAPNYNKPHSRPNIAKMIRKNLSLPMPAE